MSSKRRLRRKSCEGKIQHETQKAARYALYLLKKDKKFTGGRMDVYKCPFCKKWHVGHLSNKLHKKRIQGIRNK